MESSDNIDKLLNLNQDLDYITARSNQITEEMRELKKLAEYILENPDKDKSKDAKKMKEIKITVDENSKIMEKLTKREFEIYAEMEKVEKEIDLETKNL